MDHRHHRPGLTSNRQLTVEVWGSWISSPVMQIHVMGGSLLPWGNPRMTLGQCGSLPLHCNGLAPSTSCRSPGAPWLNPAPYMAPFYTSDPALAPRPQHSVPTCPLRLWSDETLTCHGGRIPASVPVCSSNVMLAFRSLAAHSRGACRVRAAIDPTAANAPPSNTMSPQNCEKSPTR